MVHLDENVTSEVLYLDCACMNFVHSLRFHYDPEYGELQAEMHLGNWHPWYRRVWYALKYIFKATAPTHLQYDCTLIKPEDYPKLKALVEKAEQNHAKDFLAARFEPETLEKLESL